MLAKLVWSEGTSELQLRDCAQLLHLNAAILDRAYLRALGGGDSASVTSCGCRVMRPDPGLGLQMAVIAGMSAQARGDVRLRLAARGKLLAWQQVDDMAPASELERAELLLRRLYPTLPEPSLQQCPRPIGCCRGRRHLARFRATRSHERPLKTRRAIVSCDDARSQRERHECD